MKNVKLLVVLCGLTAGAAQLQAKEQPAVSAQTVFEQALQKATANEAAALAAAAPQTTPQWKQWKGQALSDECKKTLSASCQQELETERSQFNKRVADVKKELKDKYNCDDTCIELSKSPLSPKDRIAAANTQPAVAGGMSDGCKEVLTIASGCRQSLDAERRDRATAEKAVNDALTLKKQQAAAPAGVATPAAPQMTSAQKAAAIKAARLEQAQKAAAAAQAASSAAARRTPVAAPVAPAAPTAPVAPASSGTGAIQ